MLSLFLLCPATEQKQKSVVNLTSLLYKTKLYVHFILLFIYPLILQRVRNTVQTELKITVLMSYKIGQLLQRES